MDQIDSDGDGTKQWESGFILKLSQQDLLKDCVRSVKAVRMGLQVFWLIHWKERVAFPEEKGTVGGTAPADEDECAFSPGTAPGTECTLHSS